MDNSVLNPATIANLDNLAEQFQSAQPFRHIVADDFFSTEFCQQLLDDFPNFDEKKAMNENGEVGRKAVTPKIYKLAPSYRQLDEIIKGPTFLKFLEKITGIQDLLYDPDYFGGGTHENLHGQDLDPHVDFTYHHVLKAHRRINFILYLNKEWQKEWGGNIEIHKNPRLPPERDEIKSFEPLFNRVIIFETNNISWHGFERINLPDDRKDLSRKSIALYYYTKHREEKIKPHSTIYVDRHLSSRFQPGMKLTENDLQEIKILMARRDQHLERLYANITNMMSQMQDLNWRVDQLANNSSPENPEDGDIQTNLLLQRIHDLENSTSWKITEPFRKVSRRLRRIQG